MDSSVTDNESETSAQTVAGVDTTGLLARLARPLDFDDFGFQWLELQCATLGNINAAVLLSREPGANNFKPLAKYPLDAPVDSLAEIAYGVIDEQCGLLVALPAADNNRYAAAYPVHVDDALQGIVALEVQADSPEDLQVVMGQLQWSVGWIALYFNGQRNATLAAESRISKQALALLAQVQAQPAFAGACQSLVTALATELGCDRVSIGFPPAPGSADISVQAVSHSAEFARQMGLLSAIGAAMAEALALGREVLLPQPDTVVSAPDHGVLLTEHNSRSVASVPIFVGDRYRCVLTLEKNSGAALDSEALEFVKAIAVLCSPTLEDRRAAQRSLWRVVVDKSREQLGRMIGTGYIGRKLIAAGLVLLVVFFSFATGTYRITAETELQGVVQRVMAAPFNGYVVEASVRAGDLVTADQVVARLDDKELRLEREKWLSERSQYRHEYNQAYARSERAGVNINQAKMKQAAAELALTEQQLARSRIMAPFDGLIISGDLSQRLGSFVEQGEVLFEIAPLDNYRIVLFVEDSRVADVQIDQQGSLVLSSLPDQTFSFVVTMITPMTEAREGANYFRVEARLLEGAERLRPGMQGVGKIAVDERLLIAIWTRSFTEWVSLQLWKWLP